MLKFISRQPFETCSSFGTCSTCSIPILTKSILKQKDEEDTYVNNINYVGMFDIGDEEFTLGKENTVEVPETGEISTENIIKYGR